jgi:hypothetical protein
VPPLKRSPVPTGIPFLPEDWRRPIRLLAEPSRSSGRRHAEARSGAVAAAARAESSFMVAFPRSWRWAGSGYGRGARDREEELEAIVTSLGWLLG